MFDTANLIVPLRSLPVIESFIEYESYKFKWKTDKSREAWCNSLFQSLLDFRLGKDIKFDKLIIQSKTNIGTISDELTIGAANKFYSTYRKIIVSFPLSPNSANKLSFEIKIIP